MSRLEEVAYDEGFVDAQINIVEDVFQIVDQNSSWEDSILELREYFTLKKQELDSL